MISVELARELAEAGMAWKPQPGDWYKHDGYKKITENMWHGVPSLDLAYYLDNGNCVFCPRLDQLLAEIDGRGWDWSLFMDNAGYHINIRNSRGEEHECIWGATPEEAAAQALLWILKGGKDG